MNDALNAATEKTANLTAKKRKSPLSFTGFYYKSCKFFFRLFTKKYTFDVAVPNAAKVYVARHLDMHGVATVLKSANFDMHPFMLSNFFTVKGAFNQYFNYTFSKRVKRKKFFALIPAAVCSLLVPPMAKSSAAIPVNRNSAKSVSTLKAALKHLLKGESVIVFPDVNYTDKSSSVGDIYEGFLLLEKPYFKATNRHLEFTPLFITEKTHSVEEKESVFFDSGESVKEQIKKVSDKIKTSLNL